MNIRKGFFKLTLVGSIIFGITIALIAKEDFRYKIYEAREEVFALPIATSEKELAFELSRQYHHERSSLVEATIFQTIIRA